MAINNRNEAIIQVNSAIVPTVTNTIHRNLLNQQILNSTVFEKDVIGSETPAGGAVTVNFGTKDTATVSTGVNLNVSFSNLENGAIKHLIVTKSATNTITFSGAVVMVDYKYIIDRTQTVVCYRVSNKNGTIYVQALFAPEQTVFQDCTMGTNWSGNCRAKRDYGTGKVEVLFDATCLDPGGGFLTLATLPSSLYYPYADRHRVILQEYNTVSTEFSFVEAYISQSTGIIYCSQWNLKLKRYVFYTEFYNTLPL